MRRASKWTGICLALIVGLASPACDDGNGTTAPGTGNGSVSAPTAQSFIGSFCNFIKPCCQKAGLPANGAQCNALLSAFIGPSTYNAAAGGACLGDVKAAAAKADFCDDPFSSLDSCDSLSQGKGGIKKPGETCTADEDCATSTEGPVSCESVFVNSQTIRKCQIQIRGKENDTPCVGTRNGSTTSSSFDFNATDVPSRGYICYVSDGLYCNSTTNLCAKIQPEGGPCSSGGSFGNLECVATAYCDTTAKKCAARKASGSACSTSLDDCVADNYCDSTSKTCKPLAADNSACTSDSQCKSDNCVNDKCAPQTDFGLKLYCGAP